jgi:hypothetical protein
MYAGASRQVRQAVVSQLMVVAPVNVDRGHSDHSQVFVAPQPEFLKPHGAMCIGSESVGIGGCETKSDRIASNRELKSDPMVISQNCAGSHELRNVGRKLEGILPKNDLPRLVEQLDSAGGGLEIPGRFEPKK